MSEHEKALRESLALAFQVTGKRAKEAAFCQGEDALNALLAEHRAETEALRREKADALAKLGDAVLLGRQQARDAALEGAARAADSEGVSDNRTALQRAASARARVIAKRIRALKGAGGDT